MPPDDVAAVALALQRLLGDGQLRRRLGDAGRKRVVDYFAMDRYVLRVLAAYQKAIDCSRQTLDRVKRQCEDPGDE